MTTHPGALERLIDGPPLVVDLAGARLDPSAIGPVGIRRGRGDVDSDPAAAQLSLTVVTDRLTVRPVVGDRVAVQASPAALRWAGYRVNLAGPAGDVDGPDLALWWAASGANGVAFTATAASNGAQGVQALATSGANGVSRGAKIGSNLLAGKTLPVEPGRTYTFGLDAKHNQAQNKTSRIVAQWVTAAGAVLRSDNGVGIASAKDFPRRRTLTAVAPPGAAFIVIYGQFTDSDVGGGYYFDSVTMEQGVTDGSWFDGTSSTAAVVRARDRFVGRVTDLVAQPATRRTIQAQLVVTAVGTRARAEVGIGDTPWPAEPVRNRVERIGDLLTAARPELALSIPSPTVGPIVLPRDVDRQPAAGLLDALADDTGGQLLERRSGALVWLMPEDRRNGAADAGAVTLTGATILVPSSFRQSRAGQVNDLTLAYGPTPAGGSQPTVRVVDPVAAADELADATQTTQLQDLTPATALAREVVGKRARPTWRIQGLATDLAVLTTAQRADLLALEAGGGIVRVRDLPTSGPYTDARLFAEGMDEDVTRDRWTIDLDVSEYGATAPRPRLADVPGRSGASAPAPVWSWKRQRLEWANGTPATAPAPSATAAPTLASIDPTLTLLAAAGWDPDPLR